MKIINVNGQSYQFFPGVMANPNIPGNTIPTSKTISGNKIMFFGGLLPSQEEALNITAEQLEENYTKMCETELFSITYTYNKDNRKRFIRKSTVDALEMEYLADGAISFAAIILENPESEKEHIILTDSIGQWGNNQMPIIIDNIIGTVGSRNLFKNVSIEITDKSNND